ncbi:MAG: EAL domain-containing protein [Magnetococcus sp. WYHC-3]
MDAPLSLPPMKILFVDDMATVCSVYAFLLTKSGYRVVTAHSCAQALDVARTEQPHLAIVDYHLPDGTGAELTRTLLSDPGVGELLVVMHSQSHDVVESSLQAGAIDLIYKDDPKNVFLMRVGSIRRYIEARQFQRQQDQRIRAELEERVSARTGELLAKNAQLEREIGERIRVESNLRLLAKVFECASEAIVITDMSGVILDVNAAFTAITGYERHEALGHTPRIMKSGRHDKDFYHALWQTVLDKGVWRGEIWDRRKNGEIYPKWLTINMVRNDAQQPVNMVAIFNDISESKATEERLERLAYFDALTNLPNRFFFKTRLDHDMLSARRNQRLLALLFVDLDRFKTVNDTLGHSAGDLLLQHVAERIGASVRVTDTVARLGGDEFTVILTDIHTDQDVAHVAQKILDSLLRPLDLLGHEIFVGASIGIAMFPADGEDHDTLTKNADVAMYQAKEAGRGVYRFFSPDMHAETSKKLALEGQLRRAIDNDELLLHYQPKLELASGRVLGMEALVRWRRSASVMVSPAEFIPLAEETGLSLALGDWVLTEACRQTQQWRLEGLGDLRVAVNLSAREFHQPDLLERLEGHLRRSGLPARCLEIEITEGTALTELDWAVTVMNGMRSMGIHVAMDDFGTGYSSLSYLKRLPIDVIKIDRSFVGDLPADRVDSAIIAAIITMSRQMDLAVVAEGVESEAQFEFLRQVGCTQIQGYLISRPLEAAAFARFVGEFAGRGPDAVGGGVV